MATVFRPTILRDLVLEVVTGGILRELLLGHHTWDLAHYLDVPVIPDVVPLDPKKFLDRSIRRLRRYKLRLTITGQDAVITPIRVKKGAFSIAAPTATLRLQGQAVPIVAYRAESGGHAPVYRCLVWHRRAGGRTLLPEIVYSVGDRGFLSIPPEWNLKRHLERFLNSELRRKAWSRDPSKVDVVAQLSERAYQLRALAACNALPPEVIAQEGDEEEFDHDSQEYVDEEAEEEDWEALVL